VCIQIGSIRCVHILCGAHSGASSITSSILFLMRTSLRIYIYIYILGSVNHCSPSSYRFIILVSSSLRGASISGMLSNFSFRTANALLCYVVSLSHAIQTIKYYFPNIDLTCNIALKLKTVDFNLHHRINACILVDIFQFSSSSS